MPAAGLTFAVAECPVQEHADPPHLFGLRAGVDQQINSRRLTGRRFSQTRLSYHTADERTALSGTLPAGRDVVACEDVALPIRACRRHAGTL